jgi:type IV pilus assembly protein PilM
MSDRPSFHLKRERIFCLEFGRSQLRMAYLRSTAEELVIEAAGMFELPTGIIEEQPVVDAIRQFRRQNNIRESQAVVGLARAEAVYLNYLTLPAMPDDEIPAAAAWQLKEEIPFELEQALVDWVTVREFQDEEGSKKKGILFAACQRQTVMPILAILRQCHCRVERVGHEAFHYGQCLRFMTDLPKASAVMKIGEMDAALSMFTGSKLNLVRQLPFSLARLMDAMTGVLVTEKGKVGLTLDQAKSFLTDHGLPLVQADYPELSVSSPQIFSMMRPHLEALVREIHFSLDYFCSVTGAERPEVIFLTGSAAGVKGLEEYLTRELGIRFRALPLPECFRWEPAALKSFSRDPSSQFLSVFGSAISSVQGINLLPPEIKEERATQFKRSVLRVMAFALTALFVLMHSVLEFRIHDYQARLKSSRQLWQIYEPIRQLTDRTRQKKSVLDRFQSAEFPADGVLKVISQAIPDDIILRSLAFSSAERILNLRGQVNSGAKSGGSALSSFMEKMEATPFFDEVGLVSSQNQDNILEFEIACQLSP